MTNSASSIHFDESTLQLSLYSRRGRIDQVELAYPEPVHFHAIEGDNRIAAALSAHQALFSASGTHFTRQVAALEACEQAQGIAVSHRQRFARQLLVLAENAREHCRQILLVWPRLTGDSERIATAETLFAGFADWPQRLCCKLYVETLPLQTEEDHLSPQVGELENLFEEFAHLLDSVLGIPLWDWENIEDADALERWIAANDSIAALALREVERRSWSSLGANPVRPLEDIEPALLGYYLSSAQAQDFIRAPTWRGAPRETSVFTHQRWHPLLRYLEPRYGNGLLPHMLARLLDLAWISNGLCGSLEHLCGEAETPLQIGQDRGEGIAQIETANGRLIHWVKQADGKIQAWQTIPPYHWNLHPRGALIQGLIGLPWENETELQQRLELWSNALAVDLTPRLVLR